MAIRGGQPLYRLFRFRDLFVVALLYLIGVVSAPRLAYSQTQVPTSLTITLPEARILRGESADITLTLTTQGRPIIASALFLKLNNQSIGRQETDGRGQAHFTLTPEQLSYVGEYSLLAIFSGNSVLASAKTAVLVVVSPLPLILASKPPIEGVEIWVDGVPYYTDLHGEAIIEFYHIADHDIFVTPHHPDPGTQIQFLQWGDGSKQPHRQLAINRPTTLTLNFNVFYKNKLAFIGTSGEAVESERVSAIRLRDNLGRNYTLPPSQLWLSSIEWNEEQRPAPLFYTLEMVTIDDHPLSLLQKVQFNSRPQSNYIVPLPLYSAEIRAYDALFATPLGSGVSIIDSRGKMRILPYTTQKRAWLTNVFSDSYRISLTDSSSNVAYSTFLRENRTIAIPVFTPFNLLFLVFSLLLFCVVAIYWVLPHYLAQHHRPIPLYLRPQAWLAPRTWPKVVALILTLTLATFYTLFFFAGSYNRLVNRHYDRHWPQQTTIFAPVRTPFPTPPVAYFAEPE